MDRRVRATKRDRSGKIIALCNAEETWSPRRTADVIKDILGNRVSYYVKEADRRKYVRVVQGALKTTDAEADANRLDNLPTA